MIGLPTVVLMITGAHYCDEYNSWWWAVTDVLIGLYDPKVQQLWSIRGDNNQRLSLSEGDKSSLSFVRLPIRSTRSAIRGPLKSISLIWKNMISTFWSSTSQPNRKNIWYHSVVFCLAFSGKNQLSPGWNQR